MRKFSIFIFLLFLLVFKSESKDLFEKPFVLFVAGRNNIHWYKKNLDSIFSQQYQNYHVIYIDDYSNDGTGEAIKSYIEKRKLQKKITLILNDKRKYKMANQYDAIHTFCKDSDIVVEIDADDWFAHKKVLKYLNEIYSDPKIWLTYGKYIHYPSGSSKNKNSGPVPKKVIHKNNFRKSQWLYTGLRTYYAGLFKLIKKNDLMYKGDKPEFQGKFLPVISDAAIIFPMLEMCGDGHFTYIQHPLYVLNRSRDTDYDKEVRKMWKKAAQTLRNMPKYSKLKNLISILVYEAT